MYDIEFSDLERRFLTFRRVIHPHLYKLKYIGASMVIFAAAGPMLILMRMFTNTLTLNVVIFMCMVLGPIIYIIGYVYDNGYVRAP
ncbi:MAG: hypothetical protein HYZ26_04375 [Chloroflexi bacterium]|nr:hypothetical protein [Chloroflexota bacterium]